MNSAPLRTAVIGCGRMGAYQAALAAKHGALRLTAVCDADEGQAARAAESSGAPGVAVYTDVGRLLAEQRPEVVNICTPHDSHAAIAVQCAEAGVRGIYLEKPIATNLRDADAVLEACRRTGTLLVVNSQRRVGGDLLEARRLIDAGALGEVRLLRGHCAGDFLSDGVHMIDSLLWLAGDAEVDWVLGQVHGVNAASVRYGHLVEQGAMAVVQLKRGPRLELFCGDLAEPSRIYQDYEAIGTKGQLWRTGDVHRPNLFVRGEQGGSWMAGKDDWAYKPVAGSVPHGCGWTPVVLDPSAHADNAIEAAYDRFVRCLLDGGSHPMSGAVGYRNLEVVMAIFESARLRARIGLPLRQREHPFELILTEGGDSE